MKFTRHARQRMEERDITEENVGQVLLRPIGDPEPGSNGGLVYSGSIGGRTLKVVCSVDDDPVIVSAFWAGRRP